MLSVHLTTWSGSFSGGKWPGMLGGCPDEKYRDDLHALEAFLLQLPVEEPHNPIGGWDSPSSFGFGWDGRKCMGMGVIRFIVGSRVLGFRVGF